MEGDARGEEVSGRGGGTRLRVNRKVRLVMIFYGWHAGGVTHLSRVDGRNSDARFEEGPAQQAER